MAVGAEALVNLLIFALKNKTNLNESISKNIQTWGHVLNTVVFLAVAFDWMHWHGATAVAEAKRIFTDVKPYCHGNVIFEQRTNLTADVLQAEILNAVNHKRHLSDCTTAEGSVGYDPEWIYGSSDLQIR
jgi:hypothetical protein